MGESKTLRVMVVDDDRDILDLLKYNLEKEGFHVRTVEHSTKAMRAAVEFAPDLIVLDLMMPHPNGIELCRELRTCSEFRSTVIFFLTAKSDVYYQHAALQTGGDDYVEKITGIRALTNKVNFVLKKKFVIRKCATEVTVRGLRIDRATQTISWQGQQIPLNRNEFELIFFFGQNPDRLISISGLTHILYGSDTFVGDKSIDSLMQNLNRKMPMPLIEKIYDDRYRLAKFRE